MKKKMMAVLLAGVMVLAAGCGAKVTVGEYKGLALTSVSQAEVDAEIQALLEENVELVEVDRAAAEGDTVNINYVGLLNGEAFEGGTDDSEAGTDLKLGSNRFIDGFEEGLIGAVAGEQRDLNLTFPEDYGKEELNGQAVVFQVTVNAVKEEVIPELTDEFIASVYEDIATVEEYKAALVEEMNENAYYNQALELLMESSEVKRYDKSSLKERTQMLIESYTNYANYYGAYYGWDEATAIMYILGFESVEAFQKEMGTYAEEIEKQTMILEEIAKKEGIELTDEEYTAEVTEMAESYGYEDVASFEEQNGKDLIKESIIAEKVMKFIIENAVISEAAGTTTEE